MKHKYCDRCHKEIPYKGEFFQSCIDHICKECYDKLYPTDADKAMMYYFGCPQPSYTAIANLLQSIASKAAAGGDVEQLLEDVSIKNGGYFWTEWEDEEDFDEED